MAEDTLILRDRRTEKRYFLDNVIIDHYGPIIGAYGIAVYNVLVRHSNADTGMDSWPSHKTIAHRAGCSVAKVKEVISQLVELKLIVALARFEKDGGQTSNEYWILEPPAMTDTSPPVSEKATKNPPVVKNPPVSAPKEAREPAPELEYEDVDEDDYPVTENRTSRHKWQIADTEEQKEFLAVCGAKYFELKQKRKVKALIKAFDAGDIAGTAVYERCLKHLEDKTQLEDVPPLLPRDWYDYRVEHARANHWNRWGFINALLDRDKLAEHCRIRQREIERNPVRTFRTVEEAERGVTEPVVLDLEQMKRDAAAAGFRWVEG